MRAPLPPLRHVPPNWVRTSTGSGGAFAAGNPTSHMPRPVPPDLPASPPPAVQPEQTADFEPFSEPEELLLPPPPEAFDTLRSEDGQVVLTDAGLALRNEQFSWRELEGVDVQPVRWLLGVVLGALAFLGFLAAYLQFWLKTAPAVLGIGLGLALLAWGLRGTNRWRLHRPGRQTRYFSLGGPVGGWQALAREANRRIARRHHETATAAGYWLQQAAVSAAVVPEPDADTAPAQATPDAPTPA